MGRRKKKKEITIKSNETKIVFGLVVMLIGVATIVAPFLDAVLLAYITEKLGYASVLWGLVLLYLSIKFIWKPDFTSSNQVLIGLILLALTSNVFFSFWLPETYDYAKEDMIGGALGASIHFKLLEMLSRPIEFIMLIIFYIIGISLATGVTLEQITNAVSNFFSSKEDAKNKELKPTIENYENGEEEEEILEENIEPTIIEEEVEGTPVYIEQVDRSEKKNEISEKKSDSPDFSNWKFPGVNLLQNPVRQKQNEEIHKRNAIIIEKTLESFGLQSKVTNIAIGPTVVQYALSITVGTRVSKVTTLKNDLALALATSATSVRIEAPIPGTSLVGIEIPNPTPNFVYVKEMVAELLKSEEKYELPLLLGKNVAGKTEIRDLVSLPHLLVAGATGTGKSVGINSILLGLLMTKSPEELKLILVDPKMVEMALYADIPHLYTPVITDMELVKNALQWAIQEMQKRYRILRQCKVRKITEYHAKEGVAAMPYIVIVIDEMADLMLTFGSEVESKIIRLAQMSRAVGIHLILATQRPSVQVITGIIKANVPGRLAYSVTTAIDSRVIIDQMGAETLIGKGDSLFKSPTSPRPIRIQSTLTENNDIEAVVEFIKEQVGDDVEYLDEITSVAEGNQTGEGGTPGNLASFSQDARFSEAAEVVIQSQRGSASLLQRKMKIGYNRAASIMDDLEKARIVAPSDGTSAPRKVLVSSLDQVTQKEDENV